MGDSLFSGWWKYFEPIPPEAIIGTPIKHRFPHFTPPMALLVVDRMVATKETTRDAIGDLQTRMTAGGVGDELVMSDNIPIDSCFV